MNIEWTFEWYEQTNEKARQRAATSIKHNLTLESQFTSISSTVQRMDD